MLHFKGFQTPFQRIPNIAQPQVLGIKALEL